MRIDIEKAVKPARRLRKLLEKIPRDLPPEYVHKVRTQARKLEASVHALEATHDRSARRLLKRVKPFRKAAGGVRDMDVMIDKTMSVAHGMEAEGREALLRLTEQMAAMRAKNAGRLRKLLDGKGKSLQRKLKSYVKRARKAGSGEAAESMATPQLLTVQLQHWPRLKADNLHQFRIHAKELRYMLQLTPEMDEHTLNSFSRVKDVAGEWHDWLQLREHAGKVLDEKADHAILQRLAEIEHEKLRAALAAANAVRHNGLAAM